VVVSEHLKKCADQTRDKIKWLIGIEKRAFTLNTHYYSDYKDKFLSYYRSCREKEENGPLVQKLQRYTRAGTNMGRQKAYSPEFQDAVSQVLALLPTIGLTGTQATDLARLLPPDPMEPALNIMASVRAYFQGMCIPPFDGHWFGKEFTYACVSRVQEIRGHHSARD
jgi:hypothetical protein